MSETAEFVVVVTGSAQDELHLSMEACLEIASRGDRATLVIPSYLFSAIPPSFTSNPLVAVAQIGSFSGPPKYFDDLFNLFFRWDLEDYLEERRTAGGGELPRKLYAVAESTREVFRDFNVTVEPLPFELWLRTAIQRLSKAPASDVRPGEFRLPSRLPEVVRSDLKIKPFGPPRGGPPGPGPRPGGGGGGPPRLGDLPRWLPGGGGGGPPKLGNQPPWVPEVEGSTRLMFNNSADPEQPFLDIMGDQMKTVGGIRPLLPEQYSKMSGSVIDSREILSHLSTGGVRSHRGWNLMVEAVGQAVPLQAWPSRDDQHHNAKLGVSHRHPTMGKFFRSNSIAETSTHRSRFGMRPFLGKRYYTTLTPQGMIIRWEWRLKTRPRM